jgi:hypothetical protein
VRRVAWRPLLLAICAVAALAQVAYVLDATGTGGAPPWLGSLGANTSASSEPFHIAVTSVDPSGPAARAGVRPGDLIDIRQNTLVERYFLLESPLNGRAVLVSVVRSGSLRRTTVVPRVPTLAWTFWLFTVAALWLLLFATLLAWRGAEVRQTRLLSLWIATFAFTGPAIGFASPWASMYVLQSIAASIVGPLSVALLAALASGFAQPLSLPRRIAQRLCYAFLAIFTTISLIGTVGIVTLRFDPLPFVEGNAGLVAVAAAVVLAALCGFLAIAASRGLERQRAVWMLVPLAAFFCFFIVELILSSSSSYADTIVIGLVSSLVLLLTPITLTYAALSRRLIDVGFFLNRAAVFTIVSAIVIGAFILAEWAASAWLASATRTASSFIGMLVALGLGVSLRFIHGYVERFVDRVFFRKRHEDEAALRRFAHEASYISDRSTLLERAVQTVKEHTNADDAAIVVRDGGGVYEFAAPSVSAEVGENDPGLVALRAWRKPVDLHRVTGSRLHGEFAFPMISRGELVGALVCGVKRDGEAYAPDESDALLALAHGVGTALDSLSARNGDIEDAVRDTQTLMLQELRALSRAVESALRANGRKQ